MEGLRGQLNVEFAVLPADTSEALKYHFMTADDDCYRYEAEKDRHVAVAAFGDTNGATNLAGIFDQLWEHANSRPLPIAC